MTDTNTPECREHGPMEPHTGAQEDGQRFTGTWHQCVSVTCYNAVVQPAKGVAARGELTITHTRADGTLLDGSRKGDGVFEIVRGHRFWFGRSLPGFLFIRNSRDKQADRWSIRGAAQALAAAGWTVVVDIDEDTRRTFKEAEAERVQRAEERAERYTQAASAAAGRSEAADAGVRRIAHGIPLGQPILVGHHSEGRARRDIARMDAGMRRSIDEGRNAERYAEKAATAAAYEAFRNNPGRTLRRIAKLEAELRGVRRWLAGEQYQGYARALTPGLVAELNRRVEEIEEELQGWRDVIAKAEADGFKVWGRADFQKGDFVRWHGRWWEALRVNPKTVTVPHIFNDGPVVSQETNRYPGLTYTLRYDEVSGRKTAEEMRALLAAAEERREASQS